MGINGPKRFSNAVIFPAKFIKTQAGYDNWTDQDTGLTYLWNDKNVPKAETSFSKQKSIFDPSPLGWRVPINEVWGNFSGFVAASLPKLRRLTNL